MIRQKTDTNIYEIRWLSYPSAYLCVLWVQKGQNIFICNSDSEVVDKIEKFISGISSEFKNLKELYERVYIKYGYSK